MDCKRAGAHTFSFLFWDGCDLEVDNSSITSNDDDDDDDDDDDAGGGGGDDDDDAASGGGGSKHPWVCQGRRARLGSMGADAQDAKVEPCQVDPPWMFFPNGPEIPPISKPPVETLVYH